jgi:hypothetical protein
MNEIDNISIEELRNEIIQFNNDMNVQKLENLYHSKSFSEIIGVSRKELVHSNFIAWILNENESHSLGKFPIQKFLELLVIHSKENQLKRHKELFDTIIVSDYKLSDLKIETEKSIINVGRVDIFIESNISYLGKDKKLKIVLENKVGTKEHSDQTTKYFNHFNSTKQEDDIILYVFLTPISGLELIELSEPECSSKEYIQINYQSMVDFLFEPAIKKNIPDRTKTIINEYLQSLSQPTLDKDEEEYKQGLIMALGTDERNLLTKFWDKNQKLILAALYAISSDPEQDKDVRDNATTALSNLSNSNRDRSLYSISFDGNSEIEKIRKSDIGLSTVNILDKYDLINDELFKFLRSDKTCSFQLLKKTEEVTENEKKYGKYRVNSEPELIFNNSEYFVARNWGKQNTDKFIKKMSRKFSELKYENHN